jgi:hypothetical protein
MSCIITTANTAWKTINTRPGACNSVTRLLITPGSQTRKCPCHPGTDELRTVFPQPVKKNIPAGTGYQNIKPVGVNYESYAAGMPVS